MEYESAQELPISQNIVKQMSLWTIRNFIDALVELVTNSDDSYRRLEQDNVSFGGDIDIFIGREKGGQVHKLLVRDFAEGMDRQWLEKAIKFAEQASGIKEGKSVRGYFGRGLKETIISLGKGRIDTIKNDIYDSAEVWWNSEKNAGQYRLLKQPIHANPEIRDSIGITNGNGTVINIQVDNAKMKCPDYNTFKGQLARHYALRDINSSPNRNVKLQFKDWKGQISTIRISYVPPAGNLIASQRLKLSKFDDEIQINIYVSEKQLDSPRNNPWAEAGFLIKTEGATLDLQLFKYEENEAALYFFGEILCPGITEKLKAGEPGLVDANRGGMEWKHPYCNTLRSDVEKVLAPYVDNKRKELAKESDTLISEKTKKILGNLCNLLNRFARDEIELLKNLEFNLQNMQEIMVKPDFANLEAGVPRSFSIYVPEPLWPLLDSGENIAIWSTNPNIQVLCSALKTSSLLPHPKYAGLLYSHFEVLGEGDDEDGKVVCKLGEYSAFTNVKVATPKKLLRKKRKLGWKWGGLFAGIEPNQTPKPLQRVKYDPETCEIHIFVNFPSVSLYIGPKFEGADTEQGRIMLAELISEAFCRHIAMEWRKMGKYPYIPGAEIDGFNSALNKLQRKYSHHIHKAIALTK